jgi:lysophospholipase L1-like esterase
MNFLQKLQQKAGNNALEGVTVAFLGDSVTQGCFELVHMGNGVYDTVFDRRYSYEQYFSDWMATLFPSVTVNIINAGISGDNARNGAKRVVRDVLRHAPDLVVVCYGLNDCGDSEAWIPRYLRALSEIFAQVRQSGSDVIFLTPNMMNTRISPTLCDEALIRMATVSAEKQNSGLFDAYIHAAKALCAEQQVPVCDCYAVWKALAAAGADTTELLSNKINHPTREMNRIFAYELVRTVLAF